MDHSLSISALRPARGPAVEWLARGTAQLKTLGPYALVVLLVPGGSLIALALWLYRAFPSRGHTASLRPAFSRSRSCP